MPTILEMAVAVHSRASTRPLAKMSIAQFAGSGRAFRHYSPVLGCDVLIAADNADPAVVGGAGLPVYWARELYHLKGIDANDLRLIHEAKVTFDGEVLGDEVTT